MRYGPRPKSAIIDDRDHGMSMTADQVIVPEFGGGTDTGLLDINGTPLYRYPDPIGFDLERKLP